MFKNLPFLVLPVKTLKSLKNYGLRYTWLKVREKLLGPDSE